jgi:hypothetical protein
MCGIAGELRLGELGLLKTLFPSSGGSPLGSSAMAAISRYRSTSDGDGLVPHAGATRYAQAGGRG